MASGIGVIQGRSLNISATRGLLANSWDSGQHFSNVVFAYSGIGDISLAAAETQAPRRNIPFAARRIFWRVSIFYGLSPSTLSWPHYEVDNF